MADGGATMGAQVRPFETIEHSPREVGPYRVLGPLGSGGMGVVLRAEHIETGERVAVKTVRIIHPHLMAGLRREVRALSRLTHPGIVRIVNEGLGDPTPWYAMELLEGQTLGRAIRDAAGHPSTPAPPVSTVVSGARERPPPAAPTPTKPPDPAERDALLRVVPGLCDALAFLHGEGIAHLDLKPDNVFLTRTGPVLMDFGLSARSVAVHGREDLDVVGRGLGTLAYIAPEQLLGDRIDARADLYALGCILYEIVTGTPPFKGERAAVSVFGHLELPPKPPRERGADVSDALEALILGLLKKAPDDRVGYAADVADVLRSMLPDAVPPSSDRPARSYLYRPPMVSRDAPFETLSAELAAARAGATRVALVSGESGVGKTRLALEVARRKGDECVVITGECTSLGVDTAVPAPLAPLTEVFHTLADRVREGRRPKLEAWLDKRAPTLASLAPALRDLPQATQWAEPAPLPARAARTRLVRAALDALFTLAEIAPLVLIVDDAQWADDLTLEVLLALAEEAPERTEPLLVLATRRSEESRRELDTLATRAGVTHVELGRLDHGGARSMVDGMLGRADLPAAMIGQVTEHAEGNPFFIAEYLRAAVREGVLSRIDGRWIAHDPDGERAASLAMPSSIRELVAARLGRLSEAARAVAELCAVIGRDQDPETLPGLFTAGRFGPGQADFEDALRELVATQMLEALPDGRLRFAHAKLHEGVYGSLPDGRRVALHRRVASAIERTPERPGRAALLAHHRLEGAQPHTGLDALEQAALEALGHGRYSAARRFLERAQSVAARHRIEVPKLREARWERGLGDALFAHGDLSAAAARGRAALERLGHPLPESGLGTTLALLRESGRAVVARARPHESREALVEASLSALRIAEAGYFQLDAPALLGGAVLATTLGSRAGAEARVAKAWALLGVVLSSMGLRQPGFRMGDRAIAYAASGDESATQTFTLYAKAMADIGHTDFALGRQLAERAGRIAREAGDSYADNISQTVLGHCEHYTGQLEAAAARYRRLAERARAVRTPQHEAWGLYAEARSLVHIGDCTRAVDVCRQARARLVGQNDAASELICEALLAWALLGIGERDEARSVARSASAHIQRSSNAIWPNMPGYAAAAATWLALAEDCPDALEHAAAAQKALRGLVIGAPIARSVSLLYEGRIALVRGAPLKARRALCRARDAAMAQGIPLFEGLARKSLARALTGAEARHEAQAAARTLTRIGAQRHLSADLA